jgi:hypothetical protein
MHGNLHLYIYVSDKPEVNSIAYCRMQRVQAALSLKV